VQSPPPPPIGPLSCSSFTVSNTSSATRNTASCPLALAPGVSYLISSCAAATGDTYFRLFSDVQGQAPVQVSYADDGCSFGLGSSLQFTPPCGYAGSYRLEQGCFNAGTCGGTTSAVPQGTPADCGRVPPPAPSPPPAAPPPPLPASCAPYSAVNTNGAQNLSSTVFCPLVLEPGQAYIIAVDCTSFTGDTLLRLVDYAGNEVAMNDDSFLCGLLGRGSAIHYTVPCQGYGPGAAFTLRQGCFSNGACSAQVSTVYDRAQLAPLVCPPIG
jgi:hypothetical protein